MTMDDDLSLFPGVTRDKPKCMALAVPLNIPQLCGSADEKTRSATQAGRGKDHQSNFLIIVKLFVSDHLETFRTPPFSVYARMRT